MIKTKSSERVLPGDKLASIEEFAPGKGTIALGESIVSTLMGCKELDMHNRVINVKASKSASEAIPRVGDYITGFVDSSSPSVAQVTIRAINDLPSHKEFTGMLSLREERRRNVSPIKAADTVRAKVVSTRNSIFHLAIVDSKCGVINTVCSNCGGTIVPLGRDRVKCPECGLVDDRLLAEDSFKPNRSQAIS